MLSFIVGISGLSYPLSTNHLFSTAHLRGSPMPWKLPREHPCFQEAPVREEELECQLPPPDRLAEVQTDHDGYLIYPVAHMRAVALGCETREQWHTLNALVDDVPADPESHYTATGGWVDWETFLTEEDDMLG